MAFRVVSGCPVRPLFALDGAKGLAPRMQLMPMFSGKNPPKGQGISVQVASHSGQERAGRHNLARHAILIPCLSKGP